MAPIQRKPLAHWNPARDAWETDQLNICGHWGVWSETWPRWGMTVHGVLSALPTLAPHTSGPAYSSVPHLPTPSPFHSKNTETPEEYRARRADVLARTGTRHGPSLQVVIQSLMPGETPLQAGALMPTPDTGSGTRGGGMDPQKRRAAGHSINLEDAATHLLPTPVAQDGRKGGGPAEQRRHTPGLTAVGPAIDNLDPPGEQLAFQFDIDWGPYSQAIHQWERLTRPAPAPVEDSPIAGKARRLSPRFMEWLMGLPDGWVTDVPGVSYTAQKTALGNGVVPQQAAMAIRILMALLTAD